MRMALGAIRFQLVASASLSGWLIERFGGTPRDEFSHVDYVLPDGSLLGARSDHVGGKPPGVQIRPQAYEKWIRREVLSLVVPAEQSAQAMRFAVKQIGAPYDKDAILGFVLDKHLHGDGKYICSAFATAIMQSIGYMQDLIVSPEQVSPNGFALAFSAIGAKPLQKAA